MAWLVLVFAWLAATLLAERRRRFGFGAFASGLVVIAAVNVLNPDAFIVVTNAERVTRRDFDSAYVVSLSPDATPTLIAALPALSVAERCDVAEALATRQFDSEGWQAWNYSRERARNAVRGIDGELGECATR